MAREKLWSGVVQNNPAEGAFDRHSNPVAPTTVSLAIRESDPPSPVDKPVAWARVADALAAASAALAQAAAALGSVNPLSPGPTHTLSPTPPRPGPNGGDLTVREAINEFLITKARAGRSDRYLRQLRVSLSSFSRGRASRPLADVTLSEVEKWCFGQGWKAKTMRGYLADVRTLFHFAQRRGYVTSLVPCQVELPEAAPSHQAPGIHTPDQVKTVLDTARAADLDVMRHLAVRYFCGVRSAECHRMTDANLLEDRGVVEVPAEKAKTRRRRLVSIQPALSAWLALGGTLRPLSPDTVRRVIRLSGVPWPPNVTRHSFVSYHLAAFNSAGKTALEAGHSEAMLFAHYRALVTPSAAQRFWEIRP